jgi:predicted acyl esterase
MSIMRFAALFAISFTALAQDTPKRQDVMVKMDDGVELNTVVFQPAAPAPSGGWPAVVFVHGLGGSKVVRPAEEFAKLGYVTMGYTVRGQGRGRGGAPSGGSSTLQGPREVEDLKTMITWLKSTYPVDPNRVGITGGSQGGVHSWMAVFRHLGVAAAVPQNFTARLADAITINGSIHSNMVRAMQQNFVDPAFVDETKPEILMYNSKILAERTLATRDYRQGLKDTRVPVMIQFAWEDGWEAPNNVIRDFQMLRGPRKLYIGTGGHGSANVPAEARFRAQWTRRWFDRWLKGNNNGIENEPVVEIALLDTWDHLRFSAFPPPEARDTTLFLNAGKLSQAGPEEVKVRTFTHKYDSAFTMLDLYRARAPLRGPNGVLTRFMLDSLSYEAETLRKDMLIVGIPRLQINVAGTASRYQVNARLWDVDGRGGRRLFSRTACLLDRTSEQRPKPLMLGMAAVGYRVAAGHHIVLEISNLDLDWRKSGWWRLWAVPYFELSKTQVECGGSKPCWVKLPVLGE